MVKAVKIFVFGEKKKCMQHGCTKKATLAWRELGTILKIHMCSEHMNDLLTEAVLYHDWFLVKSNGEVLRPKKGKGELHDDPFYGMSQEERKFWMNQYASIPMKMSKGRGKK